MVHKSAINVGGGGGSGVGSLNGLTGTVSLTSTGGTITITPSGSTIDLEAVGAGGSPGGSNTDVQFNDSGVFGGDSDFIYDKATKTLTVISPAVSAPNPSSISASLILESLTNGPSSSAGSLIYGPQDSGSGSANENIGSGSVYVANGQNWNYIVYAYRIVNGIELTSPNGLTINFQELYNDGVSNFTVSVNWSSSTNGDGSSVDGYIVYSPGTNNYTDVGNTTSWLDDGTSAGGALVNTFTGLSASGQTINYTPYLQGTAPGGVTYYGNAGSGFSITDFLNNSTLFQVPITISGSGGGQWALYEDISATSYIATGDQTFYQASYFSGPSVSTQHYGFLADGSGTNLSTSIELFNYDSTNSLYSTGSVGTGTTDPGDSNYYYISITNNFGSGTEGKDIIAFNGGGFSIGYLNSLTSVFYDALSNPWVSGPSVLPNTATSTPLIVQNASSSPADASNLKIKSSGSYPALTWEDTSGTEFMRMGYEYDDTTAYINIASSEKFEVRENTTPFLRMNLTSTIFNLFAESGYQFGVNTANHSGLLSVLNDSDSVQINAGTANTSSWLNISAPTTTKAQLNFASGVGPTSANNGDMWFNGSYLTLHNGTTGDLHILQTGTTSSLTSGRIPVADSNGNLIDGASFTNNNFLIGNSSGGISSTSSIQLQAGPVINVNPVILAQAGISIGNNTSLGFGTGAAITQFGKGYVARTTSGTLGAGVDTINVTASGATTQTLQTAVGATGRIFTIKVTGTGTVTVATTSSQTIDGVTTQTLTQNQEIEIQSTGANWIIVGSTGIGAAVTPYYTYSTVTGTTQAAAVDSGYITNNASLVTVTLPSTAAVNTKLKIIGLGAGGWKLAQNASQLIHYGSSVTTTGTGGSLASTNQYDNIELLNVVANTTWVIVASQGNVTVV